jgi:hypothetical protein
MQQSEGIGDELHKNFKSVKTARRKRVDSIFSLKLWRIQVPRKIKIHPTSDHPQINFLFSFSFLFSVIQLCVVSVRVSMSVHVSVPVRVCVRVSVCTCVNCFRASVRSDQIFFLPVLCLFLHRNSLIGVNY